MFVTIEILWKMSRIDEVGCSCSALNNKNLCSNGFHIFQKLKAILEWSKMHKMWDTINWSNKKVVFSGETKNEIVF